MHFHLPKPLHGWREFAGEVGIIVVGVLIALGAEQVVEALHWKSEAGRARQSIAGELAGHYSDALEWRMIEPCVAAQLDRLEARLLGSGERVNPAPTFHEGDRTFVLRAPSRPYPQSVWQGILAQGITSHLTEVERQGLGAHYSQAADIDELDKQITASVTKLHSLARPIALDASARLSLLQSLDEVRDTAGLMATIAAQMNSRVIELHMAPSQSDSRDFIGRSGTVAFCRAQHLPLRSFAEAAKPVAG
jgi:hypothetical protein